MNEWDRLRRAAAMNKERYPPGTRIELIHMGEDDPNPIPDGTRGTVTAVDDIGTVFCHFDNGIEILCFNMNLGITGINDYSQLNGSLFIGLFCG